jgi:hypothetical protein
LFLLLISGTVMSFSKETTSTSSAANDASVFESSRVSEDDDVSSEEDDTLLPMNHISNMQKKSDSIRYDEYQSFLSRSERAHEKPDKPPTADELRQRKVKFPSEPEELLTIFEFEPLNADEKYAVYMQHEDFSRVDKDMELLAFRWENHVSGRIILDEDVATIRGLEERFKNTGRGKAMAVHEKAVLEEIHSQKVEGKNSVKDLDWERIRQASLRTSKQRIDYAVQLAKEDEEARVQAWIPKQQQKLFSAATKDDKKKKKKGFLGLFGSK